VVLLQNKWRSGLFKLDLKKIKEKNFRGLEKSPSFFPIFSLTYEERRITFASWISLSRIIVTPCIVAGILYHHWFFAAALFCIAALTDVADGAVARYFNQKSLLGEWLDALADKVLIITVFCALYYAIPAEPLNSFFLLFVIARELLLVVITYWFYRWFGPYSLKPVFLAKITMLLYVATVLLLIAHQFNMVAASVWPIVLWLTLVCAFVSLLQRIYQAVTLVLWSPKRVL
jgi:cardiolipin synthase